MDKKVLEEYRKNLRMFNKLINDGRSNDAYEYLKNKVDELGIDINKYPFCKNNEIKKEK